LISLRRRHPWLHRARTTVLTLSNEHIVYEASGNGGTLTVALNLSAAPAELAVPSSAAAVLAGHGTKHPDRNIISLPGHGWAVLGGPR